MKNTVSIFGNKVVVNELFRLTSLIGTDERDVQTDINLLVEALCEISKIVSGKMTCVTVNGNMWCEASDSLDKILKEFDLVIDEDMSDFDDCKWAIIRTPRLITEHSYSLYDIAQMCEVAVILNGVSNDGLEDFFENHVRKVYDEWRFGMGKGIFKNEEEEGYITAYAERIADERYGLK